MELKPYQHKVLKDLEDYLEYVQKHQDLARAFNQYWEDKIGPYNPIDGTGMELYKNNIPRATHVCLKVPTAGGKTLIAVKDRKSTRLNSSHVSNSYAAFCLKKKNKTYRR